MVDHLIQRPSFVVDCIYAGRRHGDERLLDGVLLATGAHRVHLIFQLLLAVVLLELQRPALPADSQARDSTRSSSLLSDVINVFADHLRPRNGANVQAVVLRVEVERAVYFLRPVLDGIIVTISDENIGLVCARTNHPGVCFADRVSLHVEAVEAEWLLWQAPLPP